MADYNLGTAQGRITVDGGPAAAGFKVAQRAGEEFGNAVQRKVASVEQLGRRMVAVGAAGVVGFGLAVKSASDFESGLSAVRAVSGATTEQMKLISAAALRIGKDTSFSATEATSAIEELVKAGISVEDVLGGAADATVALAAAGSISLPEAASLAANAMNQFGLSASELPKVADTIAGAANASAISVGDFAGSLQQVGAVANLAGLSFDDTAVAIAQLGNAGITASDAGTSLKTLFTNLIPTTRDQQNEFRRLGLSAVGSEAAMVALGEKGIRPLSRSYDDVETAISKYIQQSTGAKIGTADNEKATRQLGIETGALKNQFFDAAGNLKSLSDIQGILKNSTKDLTKEQKLASFELLFGSDAIRAAAVLAEEGSEGFNKLATAIGKTTAADVAKTRLDNLGGSLEQLRGTLETAQIIIGQVILPILKRFVDAVTFLVNIFNSLPLPIQRAIGVLAAAATIFSLIAGAILASITAIALFLVQLALMQILGPVTIALRAFFFAMVTGAGPVAAATAAMTAFQARLALLGARVTFLARVIRLLRAAFLLLISGPGLVVVALVALGVVLYKTFEPFKDLVDGVARFLRERLVAAVDAVKNAFQVFWDAATGNGAAERLTGVLGFVQRAGEGVARVIAQVREGFSVFYAALSGNSALVTTSGLMSEINNVGVRLRAMFDTVKTAVLTFWAAATGDGRAVQLTGALGTIQDVGARVAGVVQRLRDLFGIFFQALSGATALSTTSGLMATVNNVGVTLRTTFFAVRDAVEGLATTFTTRVVPALSAFAQQVVGAVGPALQGIFNIFVNQVVPAVINLVTTIGGFLLPILGRLAAAAIDVAGKLFGFISALAPVAAQVIKVAFSIGSFLVKAIFDVASFILGTLVPAFLRFAGPVISVIIAAIGGLVGFMVRLIGIAADVGSAFVSMIQFLLQVKPIAAAIAVVLGTVLVAALVSLAVSAATTAASVIASWISMAAGAASTAIAYVAALPGMIAGYVSTAIAAVASAASVVASWVASTAASVAAKISAAITFATMVAGYIAMGVSAAASGVIVAAMWIASLGPVTVIIAAIAAVIAIFVLLYQKVSFVRDFVDAVIGFFQYLYDILVGNSIVPDLIERIVAIFQFMVDFVSALVSGFVTVIVAIFNFLKAGVELIFNAISVFFRAVWGAIVAVVTGAVNVLRAVVSAVFSAIATIITTYINIWRTIITTAWNIIKAVVTTAVNIVRTVISAAFAAIRAIISTSVNAWRSVISTVWNAVVGIVSGVVGRIKSAIGRLSEIAGRVSKFFQDAVSAAQLKIALLLGYVGQIPGQVLSKLGDLGGLLVSAGRKIVQGLVDGIQSLASAPVNAVRGIVGGIAGLLPGSPVKEGPLRSLNRGHAGKMIVEMLAGGIQDKQALLGKVYQTTLQSFPVTDAASFVSATPSPVRAAQSSATGDTYTIGDVTISARDIAEMRDVSDFFAKIKQSARQKTGAS